MNCMRHIQNPGLFRTLSFIINSDIFSHIHVLFKHIQPYCGIFGTLCNSCIFKTLLYSESWHIQNSRYIQNSVKVYSGTLRTLFNVLILRTLPYSELYHIQNFCMFKTGGIYRTLFSQSNLGIFNSDNYRDINFLCQ